MRLPQWTVVLLTLSGVPAFAVTRAQPAAATLMHRAAGAQGIVAALHGDIYVLRADGDARHRITANGRAGAPQRSPDGRLVAYVEATPGRPARGGTSAGTLYVLPVDAPAGTAAQRIASAIPLDGAHLSWSPDSSRLAYLRGLAIVLHTVRGRRPDLLLRPPHATIFSGHVAWSPDGRRIAIPLAQPAVRTIPRTLLVGICTLPSAQWHQIVVRFPPGALGLRAGNLPVSTPGNDPVWTPDGRGFLFSTLLVGEGPASITGIWRVDAAGGVAHLVIGTAWGVRHGSLPAHDPLGQATHFLLSPDRRLLAMDPPGGIWVARLDGRHGRFLPLRVPSHCVVAQNAWLPDSAGLVYVQICPLTGQDAPARATLFGVRLDRSPPVQLYRAVSPDQRVIALGPSYRCVLCGY